jgi:hypothetical protein
MAQARTPPMPPLPESIVVAADDPVAAIRLGVIIASGSLYME